MTHTIHYSDILNDSCSTYTIPDGSPRGCRTISKADVRIGMKVLIDNYFCTVVDDEPEEEEEQPRDAETIITDIVNYLEENTDVANSLIEELDSYNGYLGDDRCYPMDELPELMNGTDTFDLLRMAYFGHDGEAYHLNQYGDKVWESSFNPNRDYFGFNGYGNLMSYDEPDYSDYIDKHLVRELSDNRRWIDGIEDDEELAELFDELEEAIAQ